MPQHTSMLWLPDALRSHGINVVELSGWKEAQGLYFWTTPNEGYTGDYVEDPSCFMVHHTGSFSATPVVRTSTGQWSKANMWVGLWDGTRLHQKSPGAVPAVVFTSAGPARVSSGYGHWPTALEVFDDVRVPWRQTHSDGPMALNRYAVNAETVHRGDGSPIDPGVEHALIVMGALLAEHYDWSPWRTVGHLTWTNRKIDPQWEYESDRIIYIQDQVAEYMEDMMAPAYFVVGPNEVPEWEPISWWLFMLEGGVIDPNANSSQIQSKLPWKTDVRLVQEEDFRLIAQLVGGDGDKYVRDGIYRLGKELASLRQKAYT